MGRVQLRLLRGAVRGVRRSRRDGRVLLQGVRQAGQGQGRLSQDRQPGQHQNGSVLREEEVWLQEEIASGAFERSLSSDTFFRVCVLRNRMILKPDWGKGRL